MRSPRVDEVRQFVFDSLAKIFGIIELVEERRVCYAILELKDLL